jgi:hypothetical protein
MKLEDRIALHTAPYTFASFATESATDPQFHMIDFVVTNDEGLITRWETLMMPQGG